MATKTTGEIPRNATMLADKARSAGWDVKIVRGRGELESGKGANLVRKAVTSVSVRLSRGRKRAFGVWLDGGYDNGARGFVRDDGKTEHRGKLGYRALLDYATQASE